MILNAGGSGWGNNSTLTLLWENPDTTVLETITLQLDINKYQLLLVLTKASDTEGTIYTNVVATSEDDTDAVYYVKTPLGSNSHYRRVTLSNGSITIDYTSSYDKCIPYRIYGIFPR